MACQTSTDLRNQVIYSVYVRNYSREGTFAVESGIVDGFRCDVAPLVPLEFWIRARGMTALSNSEIFQKGAALLYAGQENEDENRPDLFNKDVIRQAGRSIQF